MLKDQYDSAVCFITILLIIISGCKRSDSKLQEVNVEAKIDNIRQVNISDLAIDVDYINLEMPEDILLNNISKGYVNEHYIMLSDNRQCILFSKNGQFISKIGSKGRGPTEYRFLSNFSITSENDILIQSMNDLIIYKPDGTYKRKNTNFFYNSDYFISSWILINDTLIFGKVARYKGNEKYRALIVDLYGNIITFFNNLTQLERKTPVTGDFENAASLSIFYKHLYFKERFNDTLFYLDNINNLKPYMLFYLGKYSQPSFVGSREDFPEYLLQENKYIGIENIFHSTDYLFIDFQFNSNFPSKRITPKYITGNLTSMYNTSKVLGLYFKNTKDLVLCNTTNTDNPLFTTGLFNDFDAGPRFFPKVQENDSTLVMWIEAKEFKDHIASDDFKKSKPKYPDKKNQLEEMASRISEFDNPLLMFVTFNK